MFFNNTNGEIPSISINTNNEENINSRDNVKDSIKINETSELMQKLDYIISEINMMKTEIREIKRMQQQMSPIFLPNYPPPPKQVTHNVIPSYPGQPMPPYPYQLSGNSNFSKNQFM